METIHISGYRSPAGNMIIGSFGDKLCICDWAAVRRRETICRRLDAVFEEKNSEVTRNAARQLDEYFAGTRREFTIPVLFTGTDFQCRVWAELMQIPYGATVSYAELARRIGNPLAVRAVAAANASNPISIFVPCHRVIGSDRKLTGYRGGLDAKRQLLALEADFRFNNLFTVV